MNYGVNTITSNNSSQHSYANIVQSFIQAMLKFGLTITENIIADGRIHRFKDRIRGDKNINGWYWLRTDQEVAFGGFGHWSLKTGFVSETWMDRKIDTYSVNDRNKILSLIKSINNKEKERSNQEREEAWIKARQIWDKSIRIDSGNIDHPYLLKKKIKPCGIRITDGNRLVIPIYNSRRNIISLQYIDADGEKRFHYKTSPKDGFYLINETGTGTICICEGFATGASIHEATNYRVAVAFSAENLVSVAHTVKRLYKCDVIIAADNDVYREVNIGLEKAKEAATIIKARIAIPVFKDVTTSPTDFNDLFVLEGPEKVREFFIKTSYIKHENLFDFMQRKFLPARKILSPWLETGTVNMIVAKQGIGKSLLSLHIAHAIASGKDIKALDWKVEKKCRVLYLDGELKGIDIQKNMNCIANNNINYDLGTNFIISSSNDFLGTDIDLCAKEWQERIDDIISIRNPGLIIIDNILTFFQSGNIFDRNFFEKVMSWIRKHLINDVSFLFIHHESKEGNTPYGTVSIIKNMCHVFALYRSKNAEEEDEDDDENDKNDKIKQTTFIMECIKDRQGAYPGAKCAIVTIKTDIENCISVIETKNYKKTIKKQVIDIFNCEPISYKEIQKQIVESGREKPPQMSNISAILHDAYDKGLITRALAPWEEKNFIKNRGVK